MYAVPRARLASGLAHAPIAVLASAGAVIGMAAVWYPMLAVGAAAGLAFTAIVMRDFTLGVCVFTVMTFFDRVPGLEGSGATMVKLAAVVVIIAWLAHSARSSEAITPPGSGPLVLAVAGLATWALSSVLWARDPSVALSNALRLAQVMLLAFIVLSAIRQRSHVRWFIVAYLTGTLMTSAVGLTGAYGEEGGRLEGDVGDPNQLAAVLVPALVFAGFLFVALRGHWARWAVAACVPPFGVVLLYTDSQGGIVALGAAVLMTLAFAGPARRVAVSAVAVLAVFATLYYTVVTPPTGILTLTEGGGSGRTSVWKVAVEVAEDHPLHGVGSGNFPLVESAYALENINLPRVDLVAVEREVAHNTYLSFLAELGAVGLALFALVVAVSLCRGVQAILLFRDRGDIELELLARAGVIALVTMLVACIFLSGEFFKHLWLLIGLNAALPFVTPAEAGEPGEEKTLPGEKLSPLSVVAKTS